MAGIIMLLIILALLAGVMVNQIHLTRHYEWIIDDMEISKKEYEKKLRHKKWEGFGDFFDLKKRFDCR